jgi:phosphoribosylanthranilate isomerase
MIKSKLCGLSRPQDIDYALEAKPDYIGFVFAKSRRQVTKEQARELRKRLDEGQAKMDCHTPRAMPSKTHKIQVVGVFVNENIEVVADLLNEGIIDIAQLHGDESEAYILQLRKLIEEKQDLSNPIIKAVSVTDKDSILKWENSSVDYLLLDYGKGGTGHTFDWSILKEIEESHSEKLTKPYFIAGGINIDNLGQVLEQGAYGIDVSSGIETAGKKDREKMLEIVKIINERNNKTKKLDTGIN